MVIFLRAFNYFFFWDLFIYFSNWANIILYYIRKVLEGLQSKVVVNSLKEVILQKL